MLCLKFGRCQLDVSYINLPLLLTEAKSPTQKKYFYISGESQIIFDLSFPISPTVLPQEAPIGLEFSVLFAQMKTTKWSSLTWFYVLQFWLPMDPDTQSDWLFLLTTVGAKMDFRLLKSTTWAVAFPAWLGDLSDAFSRTCLLCSEAQIVTLCLFLFPLEENFGCGRSDGRKDISWHTKAC